jgi:hypothetical protein
MEPSDLSPANIIATVVAGIGIGLVAIREYLKARKTPTTPSGDRIVPAVTIADMNPVRENAEATARAAVALERIAIASEGVLTLLTEQARDDAIEEEVERRLRQRVADRRSRTTRP